MGLSQTKLIGDHSVQVLTQLAEGGYAFVFLAKDNKTGKYYALKRILAQEPEAISAVKREVDIMKNLPPHKNIVQFVDSCITNHMDRTAEFYILMEYCSGGGLVDIMQFRRSSKFSEGEILTIFSDVCAAVTHLHTQQPPIIHRDLKVENVLLHESGVYKLCDFGSATTIAMKPSSREQIAVLEEDIQKNTTLTYRSPEMIDLYQGKLISCKSDIWALGCLLYKLAFYVTPFDNQGSLAILNAKYTIPADSPYTDKLHDLIRFMLVIDPDQRPDIHAVTAKLDDLLSSMPAHSSIRMGIKNKPPSHGGSGCNVCGFTWL